MRVFQVSEVVLSPAPRSDQDRGLLGWIALTMDGVLRLHGLALRRTRAGRLAVTFPRRRGRRDREHSVLHPTCDTARREIEAAVIGALEAQGDLP